LNADIVVIGAGLMGTAIARCLSKYDLRIIVVEKESDICFGTSKATTALVHTGYTEEPGTLKAELMVKGHNMMEKLCQELDVPFKIIGELDLVLDDEGNEGIKRIEGLKKQGEINGVKEMHILERKNVLDMEPELKHGIKAALYLPDTGIVSPYELAIALMENALDNGVKLLLDSPVSDIIRKENNDSWMVKTPSENINCQFIINSSGIFADQISAMAGAKEYEIKPGRGEEYLFDSKLGPLVNHVLVGGGGLLFPTTHGNLMMGTTVVETSKDDFNTTLDGFAQIYGNVSKLFKGLNKKDIIASFAGLRAYNNKTNDYIIKPSEKVSNFIHVSIGSPGVVASPAIAERVEEILFNHYNLEAKRKEDFNPYRKEITIFRELSQGEKEKLIKKDKKYGHIVCRCETITEGEIVEAIKRGARTLDGIKYRTRAGMGRCQGGFCTPRVLNIMARELNIPVTELTKKGKHSVLLPFKSKQIYSLRREENETN
jgi:glycerol-3-phosphate dehydrogenase